MSANDLSDDDLRTLAILAAELADDASLPRAKREEWQDVSYRIYEGKATKKDLAAAAEVALADAVKQRDAKTRQRYLSLADRTKSASR